MLPNLQTEVRLTRAEFEALLRPRVTETVAALQRAIRSAGLEDADISRILLVGGSSRIPLVGQLVREGTGRPIALDAHPKHAVALGAALVGSADAADAPIATEVVEQAKPGATTDVVVAPAAKATRRTRRRVLVGIVVVAVLVGAGAAFALVGGDDSDSTSDGSSSPPSTTEASTTSSLPETSGPTGGGGLGLGGGIVAIDSATVEGDHYVIDFSTTNFEPSDAPDGYRVRFYFVRSTDLAALVNGAATAEVYEDYAGSSPFEGLAVADRPDDADQLCGAVVDSAGQPASLSGTCVQIPA
jgi:hypothetical protein